ncbi:MAG: hypothetical protein HC921_11550 [Synechococcaceae cyanobacterium SM2_3_1]|nr:hypothetical protein [Synechococcaceae cyanobacterium SM2_3_1]
MKSLITKSIISLLGILVLWVVGGNLLTSALLHKKNQQWQDLKQPLLRTGKNQSAIELEVLIKKLGREYVQVLLITSTIDPAPIPITLAKYLKEKAQDIAIIRQYVLENQSPSWPFDPELMVSFENLTEHVSVNLTMTQIQQLLMVEALSQHTQGNDELAFQTLVAGRKINSRIWDQPVFLSQLHGLVSSQYHLYILRRLNTVPENWEEQIFGYSLNQLFFDTASAEALANTQKIDPFSGTSSYYSDSWIFIQPFYIVISPYIRLLHYDFLQAQEFVFSPHENQNLCSFNPEETEEEISRNLSWWNYDRYSPPYSSLSSIRRRYLQLQLNIELTQKIIEIKEQANQLGSWPSLDRMIPSSLCRDTAWLYTVTPDEVMSIVLSSKKEWLSTMAEIPIHGTTHFHDLVPMYTEKLP